jgi:hypothetical protein
LGPRELHEFSPNTKEKPSMTFTEAAAQVLRLVGKPLHYKEITDVAIEKNLLSHVGKSPEVTMGARLAALVKKGEKDNPLVRVKPGVFALREWDPETIEKGLADRTPALDRLAAQEVLDPEQLGSDAMHVSLAELDAEEERPAPDAEERERAELAAHATELFEPEEDDDEPIFGAESEEEGGADGASREDANGRRKRRRRRRGGRAGDERGGDDLPTYTVSDAPADLPELPVASAEPVEPREPREPREARESRESREREPFSARERDRGRGRDRDRDRDRERPEESEGGERREARDLRAPLNELSGRDLADSIETLLTGFDRNRGPVSLQTLVDAAQRRGRLTGEASLGQGIIAAAARADNVRRAAEGQRPRFRLIGNRLALTEWSLDHELVKIEREIQQLAERYRDAGRRAVLRSLQELPQRALGEVVMLLFERLGFVELASVRRPGAHGAELHLSGKLRGAAGEIRAAVVVRRDGREIGRERVTELRGALHHYGPAAAGWIVTTGQVLSGAREEAAAPGAAPVTVLDGVGIAKLCEEHGVGVVTTRVELPLPDLDLFDGLRAG